MRPDGGAREAPALDAGPGPLSARSAEALARLREALSAAGSLVVGYSGGADSTLLAKAAFDALGPRVLAVTAVSPSLPRAELLEASAVAAEIGVRHLLVASREMEDEGYVENSPRRCFFCKAELFRILKSEAGKEGIAAIAYGAITDDLGDFRPGMEAAREAGAVAPLLEAGIGKPEVREISRYYGLRTWNKPASACLSSRIPFGTRIEAATLARIEAAEAALHAEGVREVRVRDHGEVARIECAPEEFGRLLEPGRRARLLDALRAAGYRFVALDLAGYRTGSLNPR